MPKVNLCEKSQNIRNWNKNISEYIKKQAAKSLTRLYLELDVSSVVAVRKIKNPDTLTLNELLRVFNYLKLTDKQRIEIVSSYLCECQYRNCKTDTMTIAEIRNICETMELNVKEYLERLI